MAFLIVFASTRAFIRAREQMKAAGIPHEVRTTPRDLYEQCGMCLYLEDERRPDVEALLPATNNDLIYIDHPEQS